MLVEHGSTLALAVKKAWDAPKTMPPKRYVLHARAPSHRARTTARIKKEEASLESFMIGSDEEDEDSELETIASEDLNDIDYEDVAPKSYPQPKVKGRGRGSSRWAGGSSSSSSGSTRKPAYGGD